MKIAILTANLGDFDKPVDPVKQILPRGFVGEFHRFTDDNFPPVTGLTSRLQYRIPKLFGWEMYPDYDIYIWLDASMSLLREDSASWLLEQLGNNDCAFFTHPWRETIKEEVDHIEDHLQRGKSYIVNRYKNGLHKEFLELIQEEKGYKDDRLLASNVFIYRNNTKMQEALQFWWFYQSRYFTCDQVQLPFALWETGVKVKEIYEDVFKCPYISLVSPHK